MQTHRPPVSVGPSPSGISSGQTALSQWPPATHQRAKTAMLYIVIYFFVEQLYPDTSRRDLIFAVSWALANSKFTGKDVIRYDTGVQKGVSNPLWHRCILTARQLEKQVSNIRSRSLEKIRNIVQRMLIMPDATPQQIRSECQKLLLGGVFHYATKIKVQDLEGAEGEAQAITVCALAPLLRC